MCVNCLRKWGIGKRMMCRCIGNILRNIEEQVLETMIVHQQETMTQNNTHVFYYDRTVTRNCYEKKLLTMLQSVRVFRLQVRALPVARLKELVLRYLLNLRTSSFCQSPISLTVHTHTSSSRFTKENFLQFFLKNFCSFFFK